MADSTISGLSAAAVADRTMEVPVNKGGGENAKVTLEQIVDLVSDTISNVLSVAQVPASVTSAELASVTSGMVGGSGSVTSAQLSAVSSQISLTNSALGSVDAHAAAASAAATSVDTRVNALSAVAVLISDSLSNEISARAASIQTLSAAVTSVNARVTSVLSNDISNLRSVDAALEVHVSAASAAVTSVDARVNVVSDLVSVLSTRFTSAASTLSHLASIVSNVSAQSATGSATGLQNAVNLLSNKISQLNIGAFVASARNTAALSVQGAQSIIDALSNRISAGGGGGLTSTQVSNMIGSVNGANYSCRAFSALGTAATSIKGIQNVMNQISNTLSGAFSAGSVIRGQIRVITATIAASVGTGLTDIDGTTVSVSAGGFYKYESHLNVAMSAANAFGLGLTFPGMVDGAATGIMWGAASVGASDAFSIVGARAAYFDDDGSGSILLSVVKGAISVSPVMINATFGVSTAGNIVLQYRASVSTSNAKINPGSYVRLLKLN